MCPSSKLLASVTIQSRCLSRSRRSLPLRACSSLSGLFAVWVILCALNGVSRCVQQAGVVLIRCFRYAQGLRRPVSLSVVPEFCWPRLSAVLEGAFSVLPCVFLFGTVCSPYRPASFEAVVPSLDLVHWPLEGSLGSSALWSLWTMCMYFSAVHPLSCSAGSALNLRVGLVLCLCVSSCGVLFAVLAIEPVFSGL